MKSQYVFIIAASGKRGIKGFLRFLLAANVSHNSRRKKEILRRLLLMLCQSVCYSILLRLILFVCFEICSCKRGDNRQRVLAMLGIYHAVGFQGAEILAGEVSCNLVKCVGIY